MDDFVEQIVERRHSGLYTVLYIVIWIFIVVFGLIALMSLTRILGADENGIRFDFMALIQTVVFGGAAFLLWRRSDYCRVSFDYTFTNGTLDVGQVLNNKRRRYLTALEMKEVVRCGPCVGQAFEKTLAEQGLKKHNWFVNRDAKLYFFYFVKKSVKHMAVMELNDEMVRVIRSRNYLPHGAWTESDGKSGYGVS